MTVRSFSFTASQLTSGKNLSAALRMSWQDMSCTELSIEYERQDPGQAESGYQSEQEVWPKLLQAATTALTKATVRAKPCGM